MKRNLFLYGIRVLNPRMCDTDDVFYTTYIQNSFIYLFIYYYYYFFFLQIYDCGRGGVYKFTIIIVFNDIKKGKKLSAMKYHCKVVFFLKKSFRRSPNHVLHVSFLQTNDHYISMSKYKMDFDTFGCPN
jgi:hypothetical protein